MSDRGPTERATDLDAPDRGTKGPAPAGTDHASGDPTGFVCDLCGAPMIDRHCKLACPVCGYQRDCSDP